MNLERKKLIELLPAIHRIRDREAREPLLRLLSVIAEQIEVLQENIDQLYDDQFIETCAEWVVPYIGDLVGTRGVRDVAATGFSARAYVANTIAYRRRKGTAAMLEQLARDLSGWNAAVVEYFLRLAWTQNVNHVRHDAKVWLDLRDPAEMERLNTPFEHALRTIDVRRISKGRGRHNIPNIGIFLWRLDAYSLTRSPAVSVDAERWMFSPLGNDTTLFSLPVTETEIAHLAERENVPMPITRRELASQTSLWYGDGASIQVRLGGVPVAVANVKSCDLADAGPTWEHSTAPTNWLGIDPVLGRLILPDDPAMITASFGAVVDTPATRVDALRYTILPPGNDPVAIKIGGVPVDPSRVRIADLTDRWNPPIPEPDMVLVDEDDGRMLFDADPEAPLVTYYYGAPADVGGGEYERESSFVTPGTVRIRVPSDEATIANALTALGTSSGVIEISDSGRYEGSFTFNLAASQHIELRSENNARPAIIVPSNITIIAAADSELMLNGLLIAGGAVAVPAGSDLRVLHIRHCTLVPGRTLNRDGTPVSPNAASLVVATTSQKLSVEIDRSTLGPIDMDAHAGRLTACDSIIDSPARAVPAIDAQGAGVGPSTTLERCTIFGSVSVQELTLASECIFTDLVTVQRKQSGCIRFSFVSRASRTPRRYRCQPELAVREAVDARKRELAPAAISNAEATAITDQTYASIRPAFVSTRFGHPAYAQLAFAVHRAITTGAEDGSEMGVYRSVETARREANLRAALDEYLRFGLEAGLFYAS